MGKAEMDPSTAVVLTTAEYEIFESDFKAYDINKNGFLEKDEARKLLTKQLERESSDQEFEDFLAKIDLNGDGHISLNEYLTHICGSGWRVETNQCVALSEEEMVKIGKMVGTPDMHKVPTEDLISTLWHFFNSADTNGTKMLDEAELRKCLQDNFTVEQERIDGFMAEADLNKDGKICWQEFIPVMMSLVAPVIPGPPDGEPPAFVRTLSIEETIELGAPPPPPEMA